MIFGPQVLGKQSLLSFFNIDDTERVNLGGDAASAYLVDNEKWKFSVQAPITDVSEEK